ncbi:MAG: CHAT domain-containing tetratricopeptide repeat protein [Cyanobacteriota bacterium]|nr:CHAT domain-containing tetratricopeptide repeat protein [Cyanobacteriota bacterium]
MNDPTPPRFRHPQAPCFVTLLALLMWVPLASGAAPLRQGGGGQKAFEPESAGHRHSAAMRLAQAPAASDPAIPAEVQGWFDNAKAAAAKGDGAEALRLQKQVVAWLEAHPQAPAMFRARALINLGNFFATEGQKLAALAPTVEAVRILRQVEGRQPEYRRFLAIALNNLGIRYSELGRSQEALAPVQEAVKLFREQAKTNPAVLADLAGSLSNLGIRLSDLGRHQEALAPTEDAVRLDRELAKTNPAHLSNLAGSLTNLGNRLSGVGRRQDALAPSQEAVQIYRELAKTNLINRNVLASALNNLGLRLSELGQHQEALAPSQEAVRIRRELVKINPAYLGDLARTLGNLGVRYLDVDHHQEGLALGEEALKIYRNLAKVNAFYLDDLALTLSNLSTAYSQQGRRQEALATSEEAVRIYLALAKLNPTYFGDLARSLNNLNAFYRSVGRKRESLASGDTAVNIWRNLAKANEAYLPNLGLALTNLAGTYSEYSLRQEALAPAEEAMMIFRELAKTNPVFRGDLALSTSNLGVIYKDLGRQSQAFAHTQEALTLYRLLARGNPIYLADQTRVLANLGLWYSDQGRSQEALAAFEEAVSHYRQLAKTNPTFLEDLARNATNLAVLQLRLANPSAALPSLRESVSTDVTHLQVQLPLLPEARRLALVEVFGDRWQIPFSQAQQGEAGAALALFTRLNRHGLLQDIQRSQALLARSGPQRPLFEQLTMVTARLANTTLTPLQQAPLLERKEQMEQELYRQLPQIQPRLVEPRQVAGLLPAKGVLVEFQRYKPYSGSEEGTLRFRPPRYLALLLRPDGAIRAIPLGEAAPIDAAVAVAVAASADPKRQPEASERLAVVSRLVLAPLQQALAGVRELFVSPDGELNRLPFAALPLAAAADHAPKAQPSEGRRPEAPPATSSDGAIPADGPSLGEVVALRLLTTGRDLLRLQQPAKAGGPAVLIANPDFNAASRNAPTRSRSGASGGAVRRPAQPSNTSAAALSSLGGSASARGGASASAPGTARASAVGASSPADSAHAATPLRAGQQRSRGVRGLTPWQPLAGTEQEARQLAPLLGVSAVIRGPAATASVVLRQRAPRILHIATHGFFLADQASASARASSGAAATSGATAEDPTPVSASREDPLQRSGLVFAGANRPDADPNDDGYLTAAEATTMDLEGTELVTLSACETGLGGVQSGEGVYGLQRSLAVAGARSTLLSLWKVDDALTATFMQRYYSRLKAGEGRAEALRHTQSEFRDHKNSTYNDIRVWGAFQLSGDWRALPKW